MMKNVSVQWFESGLIIGQEGIEECVTVPNFLKYNFYEEILNALYFDCSYARWSDLESNRLLMNYEHKNHFNCFLNGMYVGDLPFIPMSKTSIAIPIDTNDTEQLYEIFDSSLVETYLLYESELLF